MENKKSITVCVPLYNEEDVVEQLSNKLKKLDKNLDGIVNSKFLLVDDGSVDNTYQELNEHFSNINNFQILQHKNNLNLDGFLKTVISNSSSDYITFLDSDSTFDPELIIPMLEISMSGVDVVNASHLHPKGGTVGVTFFRKGISIVANSIYRKLLSVDVYTFTSILKIYKLEKIKTIEIESKGFVAVTELLVKSLLNNYSYVDFPCILTTREEGSSKIKFSKTIIAHLKFMIYLIKKKILI